MGRRESLCFCSECTWVVFLWLRFSLSLDEPSSLHEKMMRRTKKRAGYWRRKVCVQYSCNTRNTPAAGPVTHREKKMMGEKKTGRCILMCVPHLLLFLAWLAGLITTPCFISNIFLYSNSKGRERERLNCIIRDWRPSRSCSLRCNHLRCRRPYFIPLTVHFSHLLFNPLSSYVKRFFFHCSLQ